MPKSDKQQDEDGLKVPKDELQDEEASSNLPIFDSSSQANRKESHGNLKKFHDKHSAGSSRQSQRDLVPIEDQFHNLLSLEDRPNQRPNLVKIVPFSNTYHFYYSSPIEALLSDPNHNLTLTKIRGHVMEFANDQMGARFIQEKLEKAERYEKRIIFDEISFNFYKLTTHMYGNFVIQKFLQYALPEQREILGNHFKNKMRKLSCHPFGCRVVQKALQCIKTNQIIELVYEFNGCVLDIVKNRFGTYVIQKCFDEIDSDLLQFIVDGINGHMFDLSTHVYSCRVIQKMIQTCKMAQLAPLILELRLRIDCMIQHGYANFVLSCVLQHGKPGDKTAIIKRVYGKVLSLSQHPKASHVVENCFKFGSPTEKRMLVDEVCKFNSFGIVTMLKDQFANYVIQVMLEHAEPPEQRRLLKKLNPHKEMLTQYNYGTHMIAMLERIEAEVNRASTSRARNSRNARK